MCLQCRIFKTPDPPSYGGIRCDAIIFMESLKQQIEHGLSGHSRPHSPIEHFVRLLRHPGRLLLTPVYRYVGRRYLKREKFEIRFLITDIFLLIVALGLVASAVGWFVWHNRIENRIFFEAQVAPTEIVSGAPSTLVIRYTNGTGQELKNAYLNLTYPAYFELQEIAIGETAATGEVVSLGDIAPDEVGSIKIRGVMFGNVHGEQVFETKMTFTYGEKEKSGEKISRHVFSPVSSVLKLSLEIPDRIIASQPFSGNIVYQNTGEITLPKIIIEPEWPNGFAPATDSQKAWELPVIEAGQEGRIKFTGTAASGMENLELIFHPSFVFGTDHFQQDSLIETVKIIQPQIKISHSIEPDTAKPGGNLKTLVQYVNIGETPVYNVELSLISENPFAGSAEKILIGTVEAGASGEKEIELKLRSTITQSETQIYEHLNISTQATASYQLEKNVAGQKITVIDSAIETPLTTPIALHSFGRYTSDRGDQLGRGPLPPTVGEQTKYWIFWNVSGTTNEIQNLTISGQLPNNVTFTGRQTVSLGNAIEYDANSKTVTWSIKELAPTFAPSSKIIGIAFEVAITPNEDQIGTSPNLVFDTSLSGTDSWTGAWITAYGTPVTTNLPGDLMADGWGIVVN